MSNSISALLRRNLDVFGENDPARRRALIDEIFTAGESVLRRDGGVANATPWLGAFRRTTRAHKRQTW